MPTKKEREIENEQRIKQVLEEVKEIKALLEALLEEKQLDSLEK